MMQLILRRRKKAQKASIVTCNKRSFMATMIMAASIAMGRETNSWPTTSSTSRMKTADITPFNVDLAPRELRIIVRGGAVHEGKFW